MHLNAGDGMPHKPVLYHEIILALRPFSPGRYVDATVGAGGHAWGILAQSSPSGRLLGLDVDPAALVLARERLSEFNSRFTLQHASYASLDAQLGLLQWQHVDGILVDLGVSSMQIDNPERGFSFLQDGPLNMRFNPSSQVSAAEIVNELPEKDLADILWRYGEENQSRRIARAIVQARPLKTTLELASVVERAAGGRRGRLHPATRSFQAIRIAVNEELQALEGFLPRAVDRLVAGGRLAVISFHSLEDRLVKQFFRRESRDCICPDDRPVCTCGHHATLKDITRHPIKAGDVEVSENPRARSARLRIAEKLDSV